MILFNVLQKSNSNTYTSNITDVRQNFNLYSNNNASLSLEQDKKKKESTKDLFAQLIFSIIGAFGIDETNKWMQTQLRKNITDRILNKKHEFSEDYIVELTKKMGEKNGLILEKDVFLNIDAEGIYSGASFLEKNKVEIPEIKGDLILLPKTELISVFHEMGHAIIENKTSLLKYLQRFRGNYIYVATALYAMANHKPKEEKVAKFNVKEQKMDNNKKTSNWRYLIPFIAFSPELITEIIASKHGLNFLKGEKINENLLKATKKHYLAAFATYLFVPTSIVIFDKLYNVVNDKLFNKPKLKKEGF